MDDFDISAAAQREIKDLILGEKLGGGISRQVFEYALNDKYVVKIEDRSQSFQNIIEWEVWHHLKGCKATARWLAPCHYISPNGIVMIQERTMPMRPNERPKRVPSWLTDIKPDNWGLLNGKPVCHDYGFLQGIGRGGLTKASW